MRRALVTLLAVVTLLLAAGAVTAWVYVQRASPQHDGELRLAGARDPIRIERDAHGIPTIHARSAHDAFFGLGVVHAQDRLWQLETHRRIGAGQLAEAFGEGALDSDRFLRALGVRRAAAAQWAELPAPAREALTAYADGMLGQPCQARPLEFVLLFLSPVRCPPVDSLAWAIMMAWDLGGNWAAELQRLRLAARLPVPRIVELLPP